MSGITIKELRDFLDRLPSEMDSSPMVNGETFKIDENYYARVDKPIIEIRIDEETKEMLLLHKAELSEDEINKIVENGD